MRVQQMEGNLLSCLAFWLWANGIIVQYGSFYSFNKAVDSWYVVL